MRKLSLRSTSLTASFATGLIILWSSICVSLISAINFQSLPSPNLDLSQLGRVAIAGDFDSISLYTFQGQSEAGISANGSHHLLARLPNGILASVASADGAIESMCPFEREDGSLAGLVVAGNFTSVSGVEAQGIALFDPDTSEVTPLPGLTGQVSAVLCDDTRNTIFVGGTFEAAGSSNAIAWKAGWTNLPFSGFNGPVTSIVKADNGNIIFGGAFDGLTDTIPGGSVSDNGEDSEGEEENMVEGQAVPLTSASISASPANSLDGFSDPRNIICKASNESGPGNAFLFEDGSPGTWEADFALGFVPTKLRLFNADFEGRGTREFRFTALPIDGIMNLSYTGPDGQKSFCDARCPLPPADEDGVSFQDFEFVNDVGMDGFRIDVSDWYGAGAGFAGVQLFQEEITSFAIDAFNAPECGGQGGASLSSSATITGDWQPNPSGESNSDYLTIDLDGGTNDGDQDEVSVTFLPPTRGTGDYSILVYTPGCLQDDSCDARGKVDITVNVQNSFDSPPQEITTELFQTNNFDKFDTVYSGFVVENGQPVSVTLRPSEGQDGPLNVVAQRIRLEVKSTSGGLNGLFEYDPDDTASFDTEDGGGIDFNSSLINRVGLELDDGAVVSALAAASSVPTLDPTVGNNANDSDEDETLGRPAISDDTLFVGGRFTGTDFTNIFRISDEEAHSLPGGGLNDEVLSLLLLRERRDSTLLYVGGTFTNTRDNDEVDIPGIAAYSPDDDEWRPVGAGVNGIVEQLVPLSLSIGREDSPELVISVNGKFDRLLEFDDQEETIVENFAIWIPSQNNWLENLDLPTIAITGQLTAQTVLENEPEFVAGRVSSHLLSASGVAALADDGSDLTGFPLRFLDREISNEFAENFEEPQNSFVSRRVINGQNVTGIASGLIYMKNDLNITVLGGNFRAEASDGSTIENLAFIFGPDSGSDTEDSSDGNSNATIAGLSEDSGLDSDAAFLALAATEENTLFAGGAISGRIDGNVINGLVIYDLQNTGFASRQPPPLTFRQRSAQREPGPPRSQSDVLVTSILTRPDSNEVYVAGTFDAAGSLECPSMCIYDTEASRWNSPGSGLSGSVTSMLWAEDGDAVILGGDLQLNGERRSVVRFDTEERQFQEFDEAREGEDLPGPIVAMCGANEEVSQLWVAGMIRTEADDSSDEDGSLSNNNEEQVPYLAKFDGTRWILVRDRLSPGSSIRDLQMFTRTEDRDESDSGSDSNSDSDDEDEATEEDLIPRDEVLLITGQLDIPNFGSASGALYDGSGNGGLRPYILTTTAANRPGSVARTFVQKPRNFFRGGDDGLALGFIVLIGLAISLALTFLLVVAGIVAERIRRRRDGYVRAPMSISEKKYDNDNIRRVPPEHLFGTVGSGSGTGNGRVRFGGPLRL